MNLLKRFGYLLICLTLASCNNTSSENSANDEHEKISQSNERAEAVCIKDGISVREEPNKSGKWLSRLSLGETLIYLGETRIDTSDKNNPEYHFVELSDGKQVWAYGYGILIDAKPAVIIEETDIYKRPDLVTKSDKKMDKMEFAAITQEKDNWIEIVSAGKKKNGWIKNKNVSTKKEDVAIAIMARKSILDKNGKVITEKIPGFLEEIPYKNSLFNDYLKKLYDETISEDVETVLEENESDQIEQDTTSLSMN